MARQFKEVIFLGNGEHSQKQVDKLKARLDEAVMLLSGLQQPAMSTDPPLDHDGRSEGQRDLDDCIDDICVALGREG